jgi:urease accessory protein
MRRPHLPIAALVLLLPLTAQAHPGDAAHATLLQGVMHPLTGWDHLCVLLALGMLVAGRGRRLAVACGAVLVTALMGGAALGLRFPAMPFVEPAILATVVACGLLLLLRRHIHRAGLPGLCLLFTFIHGMAHGQEAPAGEVAGYFAGFTASAVALYGLGLVTALALARASWLRAWLSPRPGPI